MDPNTVQLILFIEQMAALLAKSIVDLKNSVQGASTRTTEEILDEADANYEKLISNARGSLSLPPAPPKTT